MQQNIVIPGFGHEQQTSPYPEVCSAFSQNGDVHFININWQKEKFTDFLKIARQQIVHEEVNNMFGFSFGAMIALIIAGEIKVNNLYLASVSPYFCETLCYLPHEWRKEFGCDLIKDFENYSLTKSLEKINRNTNVSIFIGEEEEEVVREQTKVIKDGFKKINYYRIKSCKHDLSCPNYYRKVIEVINS